MLSPINPDVFEQVKHGMLDCLNEFSKEDLRPFLPILIRSGLLMAGDISGRPKTFRHGILVPLSDIEPMNLFVALLSVDYNVLESDVKKELQLRQKLGNREQDSVLIQNLQHGLAFEYERADATRKLRLLLSELLFVMSQLHEPRQEYYIRTSELFDNWIYLEDICDTLCIAMVELPNLLSPCDVCEVMLHVKHGPYVISRIVANMPDSFLEVCTHLISNADKCEEESEGGLIRLEALKTLCKLNPSQNLLIRSRCVEQCKMPALAVFLSLDGDVLTNLIPFLSEVLVGFDHQIRNWFSIYVRNGQKRKLDGGNSLLKMRECIWAYMKHLIQTVHYRTLTEETVIQASSLLHLSCALKGIGGYKFYDDEVNDLVGLVTLNAPNSPAGNRFITLGLCTLLACPSLITVPEHEVIIVEWVKSLLKKKAETTPGSVNSSFEEVLLLMAIHFHSNQLNAISELVCATLGMKIAIRVNTMSRLKQIFVQQIFLEKVVAEHAVKVPVTANLNSEMPGFLPVHCIYQLIKSRTFTKHKVPIKDWIYRQIMTSKMPIHPVLPALLEVYTQSVLVPSVGPSSQQTGKSVCDHTNEPLTYEEVLGVFQDFEKRHLAPQLLVLYYVLLYEDVRLSNCRTLLSLGKKSKLYPLKLFYQIPIKYLLKESQNNQELSGGLFPPMLRLLTTHFPQLCIVNEWLEESVTITRDERRISNSADIKIEEGAFQKAFEACLETPVDAVRLLGLCKKFSPHDLWVHGNEIIRNIKLIIQPDVPRKIQDLFRDVWYLLNEVFPRRLWEITSNALLPSGSVRLNADELTMDPIQILRCDPRVFRCAPVLSILLHILAASLAASKYYLGKHVIENPSPANNFAPGAQADIEREEVKIALMGVQDSVAVQILLEACLRRKDEEVGIAADLTLKEIQSVICAFVHQMFIADPNLAKLVHYQGYPIDLLPITVQGIPSMHICMEFAGELLTLPEIEKQIFGIQLIAHLSVQYALSNFFGLAKHVVTTIGAMSSIASLERSDFYINIVSALELLCEAFPPLIQDAVVVLMNLGKICTYQNGVERNRMTKVVRNKILLQKVHQTYEKIVKRSLLDRTFF